MTHHPDDPAVAATESGGPLTSPPLEEKPHAFKFEVVQGFFIQNGPKPKHMEFHDEMLERAFGLVDTSSERWSNLKRDVKKLQDGASNGEVYKVLFLGRHGQGWHNYGATQYGVEAWEAEWAMKTTDGKITWGPDPELTPLGISQAKAIHQTWLKEEKLGAPIKKGEMKWFLSPFTRTAQTMLYSWGDLLVDTPEAWEDFREIYGCHTCDKRSNKSDYSKRFPTIAFEPGFPEEDPLWTDDYRETDAGMQHRSQRAMDRLFGPKGAKETYISITGHSAIFRNLLAVLGHQAYPLNTGEMIPVVVRATPIA